MQVACESCSDQTNTVETKTIVPTTFSSRHDTVAVAITGLCTSCQALRIGDHTFLLLIHTTHSTRKPAASTTAATTSKAYIKNERCCAANGTYHFSRRQRQHSVLSLRPCRHWIHSFCAPLISHVWIDSNKTVRFTPAVPNGATI